MAIWARLETASPYVVLSGVDHLGAGQFAFMMTHSSGRSLLAVISAMTVGEGLWFFPICVYLRSACREGNGTPLQYSCLENPMDGGAWKAAVHGVAEGRT